MSDQLKKQCQERIAKDWHDLLFGVRRSIRYHARRRMFCDRFRQLTSALGVILGSATVFTLLNEMEPLYPSLAAALVTVLFTIDLVVGTGPAARLHNDLNRRFIDLERQMELEEIPIDGHALAKHKAYRLEIEVDEPPVHRVLDMMCHNELLRAMGYEKSHFARIRLHQRLLAHFFDVQDDRVVTYGDLKEAQAKQSPSRA